MVIAVIDGMGGGIGAQIILSLREELPTYIDIRRQKPPANKSQDPKMLRGRLPQRLRWWVRRRLQRNGVQGPTRTAL